jgi:hypothetical protein
MRTLIAIAALARCLTGEAFACSISIESGGQMKLAGDYQTLGSEVSGGSPARVLTALALLESAHIDVTPPTLVGTGSGYDSSQQIVDYAYSADVLGLVHVASQNYTTAPSTFATGVLGSVTVTVTLHNRIRNTRGFPYGTYQTQQVVTCRP